MALISASQFFLMRARKELEKSYHHNNWEDVRRWDKTLGEALDEAFNDNGRDTQLLAEELEKILATYSEMLAYLPEQSKKNILSPKK